jgi:hypothetical protein
MKDVLSDVELLFVLVGLVVFNYDVEFNSCFSNKDTNSILLKLIYNN